MKEEERRRKKKKDLNVFENKFEEAYVQSKPHFSSKYQFGESIRWFLIFLSLIS
jgi:hypothetical protein